MGLEVLIPLLVPLITELLKMVFKAIDKNPPPASLPVASAGLGSLGGSWGLGLDPMLGGLLGLAGSGVYDFVKKLVSGRKRGGHPA